MKSTIKACWRWFWCLGARERAVKDAADKLQLSMRVTTKSRYNAAVRLQHQARYAFFTTTLLSLGLIFIPLVQNSGVTLALKPSVLNMMQIFLAVAVLVYSVVIGTARYDLRAEHLTECGDRLKELIRQMDMERETGGIPASSLATYQTRYSDTVTDSENHERSDYHLAILEMPSDYFITGFLRFRIFLGARLSRLAAYLVPTMLLLAEAAFIAEMLGITAFASSRLAT